MVIGFAIATVTAGGLAFMLTLAVRPWLGRIATVHPNARSSHRVPTPQGAGIAVVVAGLFTAVAAFALSEGVPTGMAAHVLAVAAGAITLSVLGLLDDIRGLPIVWRLAVQGIAVAAILVTLPSEIRILPVGTPLAIERIALFFGGVWFINLYNFMDGIDLMSVIETVAIGLGVLILVLLGLAPAWLGWAAAALVGSVLGFSYWNIPPARLFLGDAGSLSLGLVAGALILHVAASSAVAAAIIIPLYYISDATVTVAQRLIRGEKFWVAHRDHFYQRAVRNGAPVSRVIREVAAANQGLHLTGPARRNYETRRSLGRPGK